MTKPHDPTLVNESRRFRALLLGLVLLTFAVHFASNSGGAFLFDDGPNITENPAVTGFDPGSARGWFAAAFESPARLRPIPYLSFALQWWAHGPSPSAFHLVSDALHALAALALALLLFELLATPSAQPVTTRDRALLATGAAALWALHPIQTQAVTYLVQRMTVLCGLFSLLAMWRYVRGVRTGERRDFLWSTAFYVLALMSKESAASLPVVGLLYEWIVADPSRQIGARRRRRIALAITMIPPFILAGTYAALSDQHFALGTLPGRDYTLFERILSAPRVYFKGVAMLLWPSGQALDHAMAVSRGLFTPWTTFVGWLAMGALVFVTIFTRREHRRSAWAVLSFLVLQLPENSFLNLELFFEHRLYLPSALLLPLVPIGLARIVASKNELRAPVTAAILALLALSAGLTVRRNLMWSDPVSLVRSNLQVTPGNARAHYNLGQELVRAGDDEGALRAYKEAEARGYKEAAFALATTLHRMGQIQAAKTAYQRALKEHPRPAEVWVNLGLLYKQEGDLNQAGRAYEWALEFEPGNPDALLNLGNLRLKQSRPEEAETLFSGIIAARPNMAQAHFNRMLARIAQNKKEEAREDYHAALALGFELARTYAGYFGESATD